MATVGQEWLTCYNLNIASVRIFSYFDVLSCALVTDNKTCQKLIAINWYSTIYSSVFFTDYHFDSQSTTSQCATPKYIT